MNKSSYLTPELSGGDSAKMLQAIRALDVAISRLPDSLKTGKYSGSVFAMGHRKVISSIVMIINSRV